MSALSAADVLVSATHAEVERRTDLLRDAFRKVGGLVDYNRDREWGGYEYKNPWKSVPVAVALLEDALANYDTARRQSESALQGQKAARDLMRASGSAAA